MPLSKVKTNSISDNAVTSTQVADNTITTDQMANTAIHGRRNILLNGSMTVAQRATSKTGLTTAGHHTVDRFKTWINNAGTWTASQDTNAPDGFANSFKFANTTADTSLSAGDYVLFGTNIEGQDLQRLNYGNSNAKSMTLSFWVKSNKTGTYTVEFDFSFGQKKSVQYTVNASDTWEYKTLTYSGNTNSSYVIDNVTGSEMAIYFWLAAGSQFSSGTTTDDAWHTTDANRAAGNVNLADSTSNIWQITGVQLEVGDKATPFEHRSYQDELLACMRYYEGTTYSQANANGYSLHVWALQQHSSVRAFPTRSSNFLVPKRATPTIRIDGSQTGTEDELSGYSNGVDYTVSSVQGTTRYTVCGYFAMTDTPPTDQHIVCMIEADAEL